MLEGTDATVEVDGTRIHYLTWGEQGQPALLLVHGLSAHAHWWDFSAPMLADGRHVIALDLSGHGDSDRRDRYDRLLWMREVLAVADHAGVAAPPVVVGHSMGGFVASTIAATDGGAIRQAIIVDSTLDGPADDRARIFANPKTYATAEDARARFQLVPPQPVSHEVVDHIVRHGVRQVEGGWTWKFDPTSWKDYARDAGRLIANLNAAACDVAVITAEHSEVVPAQDVARLRDGLGPETPLIVIPDAHHHVLLDHPQALAATIAELLES